MKYIKNFFSIVFVILIIASVSTGAFNYGKIIETNKDYENYYNEKTDIQVILDGATNSLSDSLFYPDDHQYDYYYQEVLRVYKQISKESKITEMTITNCLPIVMKYHKDYHYKNEHLLVGNDYFYATRQEIVEGRYFTQQEIEEGANVIILHEYIVHNTDIPWDNEKIEIGETIEILNPGENGELESVEFKVIGFYKYQDNYQENYKNICKDAFVPNNSIINLSNQWKEEAKGYENIYDVFYPIGIMNPVLHVESENDWESLREIINQYRKTVSFTFSFSRKDDHLIEDSYFDISIYENKIKTSISVSIYSLILLVLFEVLQYSIKTQEKKRFEQILSKEQEKNVQTILSINHESHKLKHDLKHLFNQLSIYVQQDEKDKALSLIDEYHEEIVSLDIPAFTQNSTVDMILNRYIHIAKKNNVNFTFSGNYIPSLKIKDHKLYVLLSNALENAFVHNNSKKMVKLVIGYVEPYCRFVITNSFDEKEESNHSKDHGYGINSMKKIIEEVKGEITFDVQNDLYVCTILIPINE